jgi:hypothetical protein
MRLGLFCTYENPQNDYSSAYAEQTELVTLVESLGFDEAWIAEHHFNPNASSSASAVLASVQEIGAFGSAREFAAFLGLTPRQNSSGGKERLGHITKMGDRYLRKLLVSGACSVLFRRKGHNDALRHWADQLLTGKSGSTKFKLVAVALANKLARIIFAVLTRGGKYEARAIAA